MSKFLSRLAAPIAFAVLIVSGMSSGQIRVGGRAAPTPPANVPPPENPPSLPPPVTDPDLVLLNVSVTGPQNAAIPGLTEDRFRLEEDGVEQRITYFWEDSRPISVGFVFDDSERMNSNGKIDALQNAAQSFLKGKNPDDEYFMVDVADGAHVLTSFATNPGALPSRFRLVSKSKTSLYDAIHTGLQVLKEAANVRKDLVVITAGGDGCAGMPQGGLPLCTDSYKTLTDQQLLAFAMKQPVQIYSVFIPESCSGPDAENPGGCVLISDVESEFVHRDGILLNDLAMATGGRAYVGANAAGLVDGLSAEIARGLKTQYIVGYKSKRAEHDGKRRGVRVKVSQPESDRKFSVWTRAAYYARKD